MKAPNKSYSTTLPAAPTRASFLAFSSALSYLEEAVTSLLLEGQSPDSIRRTISSVMEERISPKTLGTPEGWASITPKKKITELDVLFGATPEAAVQILFEDGTWNHYSAHVSYHAALCAAEECVTAEKLERRFVRVTAKGREPIPLAR